MNHNQLIRAIHRLIRGSSGKNRKFLIWIVGFLVVYALVQPELERRFGIRLPSFSQSQPTSRQPGRNRPDAASSATSTGEQAILEAFENRQSDLMVQCSFVVKRNLPDDEIEPRHQKMILRLPSGHTVMLAHNIDLADRVPAREGDTLEIMGEYQYSEQGGVIHWTHHDPAQRRAEGWIKHNGVTYQ